LLWRAAAAGDGTSCNDGHQAGISLRSAACQHAGDESDCAYDYLSDSGAVGTFAHVRKIWRYRDQSKCYPNVANGVRYLTLLTVCLAHD
jgi:hypothetical protein